MNNLFEIKNLTRVKISKKDRTLFQSIFCYMLPKNYELSLVICGNKLSQRLNRESRGKDYIPNVLSFALDPKCGEIFINIHKAKNQLQYLFIHAIAHLRSFDHGPAMDRLELRTLKKFGVKLIHTSEKQF